MFLEDVGITLAITLLSIVLGTLVGFVVFVLCRNGGRISNANMEGTDLPNQIAVTIRQE